MSNDGTLNLGVNTFFASIVKQALDDASSGNLEAISWLTCCAVPLADYCDMPGLSYHLRVFLRDVTNKIENGTLKPDYSLKYNELEVDARRGQIPARFTKTGKVTLSLCNRGGSNGEIH